MDPMAYMRTTDIVERSTMYAIAKRFHDRRAEAYKKAGG